MATTRTRQKEAGGVGMGQLKEERAGKKRGKCGTCIRCIQCEICELGSTKIIRACQTHCVVHWLISKMNCSGSAAVAEMEWKSCY
jgi:hypothetical protein